MAKINYGFDKRQRELKKAKEQEEKRQKKLARREAGVVAGEPSAPGQTAEGATLDVVTVPKDGARSR